MMNKVNKALSMVKSVCYLLQMRNKNTLKIMQHLMLKRLKYLYKVENVAKGTKVTGYVQPRNDVVDNPKGLKAYVEENKMMRPAINQMSDVVPWAAFPGNSGLEAEQQLIDMRDKILGEDADVKEIREATQNRINQELD